MNKIMDGPTTYDQFLKWLRSFVSPQVSNPFNDPRFSLTKYEYIGLSRTDQHIFGVKLFTEPSTRSFQLKIPTKDSILGIYIAFLICLDSWMFDPNAKLYSNGHLIDDYSDRKEFFLAIFSSFNFSQAFNEIVIYFSFDDYGLNAFVSNSDTVIFAIVPERLDEFYFEREVTRRQ